MNFDSELRTLLYLQKSLEKDFPTRKTLIVLKLVMAILIMICVVSFVLATSGRFSVSIAIPLVAVSGLFSGYISYYIRSVEIWPYYRPHLSKASIEQRINEISN